FRYPEAIAIPAADGRPLLGEILKPAGFDPQKKYPLIVHVYGEPNAPLVEDKWGGTEGVVFPQVLLDAGYVVASVDSRIATGASKADVSLALRSTGGDGERDDLVAAVRWLKTQPGIDPERVGVWGWSGGGTTTLLLLTRSTEFKAGIAVAPVTDRAYYDTKYVEASMKTPETNPEGYEKVSLVKTAKDLHGRLLLVHGTYDDNVHPQNTWHFVDELVKAGKPVDMMIYPMRKHDIGDRPARRHLFDKMLEFWKTYL
ncbi:MAG TPA: prolyl oligopeptidase family serine peptidase, partial [Vicinamibacteria bacterium]